MNLGFGPTRGDVGSIGLARVLQHINISFMTQVFVCMQDACRHKRLGILRVSRMPHHYNSFMAVIQVSGLGR